MEEWQVEDHLLAFGTRIGPIKTPVHSFLDGAKFAFRALWPNAEVPANPMVLARALFDASAQLNKW
jgi:hypothetical protein